MEDPLVFPSLLVSFPAVYQVVAFGRLQTEDLDGLWGGDGDDCTHLGQFHYLSCEEAIFLILERRGIYLHARDLARTVARVVAG